MPDWTSHLSYLGIVVVLILTGAGLPVPEEIPIIAAGVASYNHRLDPGLALASCLIGAVLGDCIMYGIGRRFGRKLLLERHWFSRLLTPDREAQIEENIARHGWKVFFVSRFLVGVRSPVYLTAGILKVPFRRFLVVDAICASIVVGGCFGLSYVFATHIEDLLRWIHKTQYALTAVILTGVTIAAYWFWTRNRERIREFFRRHDDHDHHAPVVPPVPADEPIDETHSPV